MASGDVQVQSAVHSVDQGQFAFLIKAGVFTVVIIGLSLYYLLAQFKGLNTPGAMDQAQIARHLASGKGFTTDYIRPLALGIMQKRAGSSDVQVDLTQFPDFFQSPLSPWLNSFPLRLIKSSWKMSPTDLVYAGDRVVAATSIIFFILSVGVWYFVLARLFDSRLALFACAAVLLTDLLWQFSLSGLPQMLVLLLFSLASLSTIFAMEAAAKEQLGAMIAWLIGAGVFMGLMTLAHGLAVWIFLGWLVFAGLYFRPRGLVALAALAAFILVVAPWMVRTYQVCGNPFGLAVYEAFFPEQPDQGYLRKSEISIGGSGVSIQGKARSSILNQVNGIAGLIGTNLVAGAFFLALFHPFRNRRTFMFKWCILLMWIFAVLGMALYPNTGTISENQFHVLFIPLFVGYGMAFLFVLWNRMELGQPLLRVIFIGVMLAVCAIPMLLSLLASKNSRVQWPPYVPPVISMLHGWFGNDEVVCSDMPWAVAWYAQRKSLLMPDSVRAFNRIHDYNQTVQPVVGLFITPITGNAALFSDIYNGVNKEWAGLLMRPPITKGFPLPAFAALPIEGQCLIFADRERWKEPPRDSDK
ncbi:hypothetical protein BH09VER1_BH09VER1_40940 [soil metagenome]